MRRMTMMKNRHAPGRDGFARWPISLPRYAQRNILMCYRHEDNIKIGALLSGFKPSVDGAAATFKIPRR